MKKGLLLTLALFACLLPSLSKAEDAVYRLADGQGKTVTWYCGPCEKGDEYISQDNRHYRVTAVNETEKTAEAELLGAADMPDVSWLDMQQSQAVSAIGQKKIALYCTHSDESYIPSDGTQSINGQGGIYDVARDFRDALQQQGIDVILDESTHLPHDSGAYRRSRQTAERLLQ